MSRWKLHPMRDADVSAVVEIENEAFNSPWPAGAFREEIRNPVARCLVARPAGGESVDGYICYWVIGEELLINNVAVLFARRGRGLGRLMLRRALRDGRSAGCRFAYLEVRPSNEAAIHLYESHGFATITRRKGYYSDTKEDALVMRATLKGPEMG